jgi:hypothetical protein
MELARALDNYVDAVLKVERRSAAPSRESGPQLQK